jgi:Tfp pilus assembly protein PilF
MKKLLLILITALTFHAFSQNKANFSKSYDLEYKLDYAGAIEAIKAEANNYFGAARLGYLYLLAKNNNASVDAYKKAISINSKSIEAHLGLASAYYANQNWKGLDETYAKILSIDPNNYSAGYNLALSKYNQKQYDQAEDIIAKVVSFYPFDYSANLLMAGTKLSLGKLNEAKTFYNNVLIISPTDAIATETLKQLK